MKDLVRTLIASITKELIAEWAFWKYNPEIPLLFILTTTQIVTILFK
jgi:hypothetical protein